MKKLDMLYNGYNSDYQMYLNDRQAWLEREAEYLRGGSSVKPAAPAAPPAPVDGMVINSNVALKPKPTVPRDTKTNVVTVDMGGSYSALVVYFEHVFCLSSVRPECCESSPSLMCIEIARPDDVLLAQTRNYTRKRLKTDGALSTLKMLSV